MNIKAIGFDYGGVIFKNSGISFNEEASRFLNVSVDDFRSAWFRHNAKSNIESIEWNSFLRLILGDLNKLEMFEAFITHIDSLPKPQLDLRMVSLVRNIQEKGYKVGLLSNMSKYGVEEMEKNGMKSLFDVFVVSCEIGYQKPDKEAFVIFTEKLGVLPEEMVFIDDSPKSLSSAEEIGFYPILFNGYEELVTEFEKIGIKIS